MEECRVISIISYPDLTFRMCENISPRVGSPNKTSVPLLNLCLCLFSSFFWWTWQVLNAWQREKCHPKYFNQEREHIHTKRERARIQNVKEISVLFLTSYRVYDFGEDTSSLGLFPYLRNGLTVPNSCGCCENQTSFLQSPCATDGRGDALHD